MCFSFSVLKKSKIITRAKKEKGRGGTKRGGTRRGGKKREDKREEKFGRVEKKRKNHTRRGLFFEASATRASAATVASASACCFLDAPPRAARASNASRKSHFVSRCSCCCCCCCWLWCSCMEALHGCTMGPSSGKVACTQRQ